MKTTNRLLLVLLILSATNLHLNVHAQNSERIFPILAPVDSTTATVAQKKFIKRYSTETDVDTGNAIIFVEPIREAWFNAVPTETANGLVFHYLIGEDDTTINYLVGLGLLRDSKIISHSPFPNSAQSDFPHYYLLRPGVGNIEIIAAEPNTKSEAISDATLDSRHMNYDEEVNRLNWLRIINRDVENINRHPNMIHYPFDSLRKFYEEYSEHFQYYIEGDKIFKNSENPELILFVSGVTSNGGKGWWVRSFHSPLLRFGSANRNIYKAFELDDKRHDRRYQKRAFDVGVLCPPNCPVEIWPPRE